MSGDDSKPGQATQLPGRVRDRNALRAALQLIPSIGPAIDQLFFGLMEERASKRVEDTLREIGEKLDELKIGHQVEGNEEFGYFLRDVIPPLSRSTNEDRRKRFRDLILNAAQVPSGDERWEEVYAFSKLLDSIDAPGLKILATIAQTLGDRRRTYPMHRVYIFLYPFIAITCQYDDFEPRMLGYSEAVIEEWALRLKEKRLIIWERRGEYWKGRVSSFLEDVEPTSLGKNLISWAVSDRFDADAFD
jgi:hypothetical protein